ncbi:MYG1 exonuclease-like isoform X1 [Mytilus californianus]|uniref:MYG1 exonuclease-like isoform X1 n=2 Tax=Mytilus californianus TaxID=6549 RepID=UPI002246A807|nr:MYG1 exonuclease-like isoform X1 [Mytilus californianus]
MHSCKKAILLFTSIWLPVSKHMTSSPPAKKACIEMKIGTHNGSFHCDEVLACFLLKHLPTYKDAEIIRTRDQKVLDTCDIVVDVGGVFDPSKNRYDHHQKTFTETMKSLLPTKKWTTKLSSAGLVYCHFGKDIVASILEKGLTDPITETIFDKVYEHFVEEIDAIDNGVNQFDGEPRYQITTTLSNRVRNLNPNWNEENADEMVCFLKAMRVVGDEFMDRVMYYKKAWLPARQLVVDAIEKRKETDPSGEIMVLSSGGCPWRDHLFDIEQEQNISPPIKFVIYADSNGNWRVQCVPVRIGSFENRLSLLSEWQGVRDDALSKLSGIPGCIFVHASGFIGGNKTYEGAMEMARKTMKDRDSKAS